MLTGGAGHNCTHERSDGNNPISMRSWAGGVQIFTRPLLMRRTAFQLFGLGDKDNGRKAHDFWSDDDVWIATEVHQAAQPLLLRNGNAGIQRAREGTNYGHSSADRALCNCTVDFDWQPERSTGVLQSHQGFGLSRGLAPTPKATSHFPRRRPSSATNHGCARTKRKKALLATGATVT